MIKLVALSCVVILASGCQKQDPLFCASHADDPRCGPADGGMEDAPVDAPPGFFTIGGTVLDNLGSGAGLVLENNLGDDLMITASGAFQFRMPIEMGMPYTVTTSSQPSDPSETCNVTNGSGTASGNVNDVTVSCTTDTFIVSGAVYGLNPGQNLTLQLDGGHDLPISGSAAAMQPFTFSAAPVLSGASFAVAVSVFPSTQTCSVTGGTGTVGDADVTTVVVDCAVNSYTIQGEVSNLDGKVTLTDGTDMVTVSANGSFAFPPLTGGTNYTVAVVTQPSYAPAAQTCVVGNGGPSTINSNVINVTVTCTTNKYTIGGSVMALTGTLVLSDNSGDNKTINANGNFTFATPIASGSTYTVAAQTQPSGQYCTVSTGNGTVANAAVTNVSVECDSGIKCGTNTCNPAQDFCCNPEGTHSCTTQGSSCNSLQLPCDSTADCSLAGTPGSCCATEMSNTVKSVACATTCSGGGKFILCDPAVVDACPMGKTCSAYAHLAGYYACQ